MRTGNLNARVTFEKRTERASSDGEASFTWEAFRANVAAAVRYTAGREQRRGDQVEGLGTHEVVTRWIAGVSPDMRIRDGETVYEIVSCGDLSGRRAWLTCSVVEVN